MSMMVRTGVLLLLFLTAAANGQAPTIPSPVRFRMKWDAHNAPVRIRPISDTLAAWIPGVAIRFRADTFEVTGANARMIRFDDPAGLAIEACVPKADQRFARGMRIGSMFAMLGVAAVVANALTCENPSGDGPGCQMVIILSPVVAAGGLALGQAVSAALPMREWQTVEVVRRH